MSGESAGISTSNRREVIAELKRLHARYSFETKRVVSGTSLPAMFLRDCDENALLRNLEGFVPQVAESLVRRQQRASDLSASADASSCAEYGCVLEAEEDFFADGAAVLVDEVATSEPDIAVHDNVDTALETQELAPALPTPSGAVYSGPEPSCRDLPLWLFSASELFGERPKVLPPGFFVRQTPVDFSNYVSESRNKRQCKLLWWPNMYLLKMGETYRPLFGRYLRGTREEQRNWIYFELIFSSYCIVFKNEMLDVPHVVFQPLFVPAPTQDANAWARRVTDFAVGFNTVPPVPPGIYIPFGRLSGSWSISKLKSSDSSGELCSKLGPVHPVLQGKSVFTLPESGIGPSYQDGGVGFMMYRYDAVRLGFFDEREHFGQPVVLFARCAFGPLALASVAEQRRAVYDAVKFALMNAPRAPDGQAHVVLDACHAGESAETFGTMHALQASDMESTVMFVNAVDVRKHTRSFVQRALETIHGSSLVGAELADVYMRVYDAANKAAESAPDTAASRKRPRPDESIVLDDGTVFLPDAVHPIVSMVSKYETIVKQWHATAGASKALFYLAPPDVDAFGDRPVVVFSFILRVRLNVDMTRPLPATDAAAFQRIMSDYGTRCMWDMMFWNPQLCTLSTQNETFMSLQQDKAPGVLGVNSAKFGVPAKSTSTSDSRRIRNPHPALKHFEVQTSSTAFVPKSPEFPPHLTTEEAASNPMLQLTLHGPVSPMGVPGTEVSIYRPYTKATATHFAGTCHAWPVLGGYVDKCMRVPSSPSFRWGFFNAALDDKQFQNAVSFLYAPLYNSVGGEIWNLHGRWSTPEFVPRKWNTAYGVSVNMMHRAMAYLLYPAFASEYHNPTTLRIWDLKQRCEAVMHWMSRDGRVVRLVFGNRRRELRNDFATNTRNYVTFMGGRVPGAPIAPVFLSAFNAFEHNLIVGETARRWDRKAFSGNRRRVASAADASSRQTFDMFMEADVIYEDVTTSMMFGSTAGTSAAAGATGDKTDATAAATTDLDNEDVEEYDDDDLGVLEEDEVEDAGDMRPFNDADAVANYDTLTSMYLGSVGSSAFFLGSTLKTAAQDADVAVPSTAQLLGDCLANPSRT